MNIPKLIDDAARLEEEIKQHDAECLSAGTMPDQVQTSGVAAVTAGSALPKLRYKLPPEMSDGQHWSVVDTQEAVIEAVKAWLAEAEADEEITIKTCMMTDEEVNALPPI